MFAKDLMTPNPVTVGLDMPLPEVAKLMSARDIGAVPVVDDAGMLRGIITESDFTGVARCVPFTMDLAPVIFGARAATLKELEQIYAQASKLTAREAMSEKVVSVGPEEELGQVVRLMLDRKLKHVPVVVGGKPVGMIARHDVLKLMAR
ncbi:MAG: CBS domain-containing protein [Phycisphaerales bacterium]|nr:CBS domain-containing protein [Phycisphaerales bacterium]